MEIRQFTHSAEIKREIPFCTRKRSETYIICRFSTKTGEIVDCIQSQMTLGNTQIDPVWIPRLFTKQNRAMATQHNNIQKALYFLYQVTPFNQAQANTFKVSFSILSVLIFVGFIFSARLFSSSGSRRGACPPLVLLFYMLAPLLSFWIRYRSKKS